MVLWVFAWVFWVDTLQVGKIGSDDAMQYRNTVLGVETWALSPSFWLCDLEPLYKEGQEEDLWRNFSILWPSVSKASLSTFE